MKRNLYILWSFTAFTVALLALGKALERGDIVTAGCMLLLSFVNAAYVYVCVSKK